MVYTANKVNNTHSPVTCLSLLYMAMLNNTSVRHSVCAVNKFRSNPPYVSVSRCCRSDVSKSINSKDVSPFCYFCTQGKQTALGSKYSKSAYSNCVLPQLQRHLLACSCTTKRNVCMARYGSGKFTCTGVEL